MRQILQDMRRGTTFILDAPSPSISKGAVLINTTASLISTGTERMLVDFGRASLLSKAQQQPEKVKMVLDKVRTDGLASTIEAVQSKLGEPLQLGYCNVGIVTEIGLGVQDLAVGDRVVSNGPHADLVRVSKNLCARIPDEVDDESASFAILASIGLQGLRLAKPTLGEIFVVTGVGLIGLLTVQLLRANGCRVIAIDYDEVKLNLARQFGAITCNLTAGHDPVAICSAITDGKGVDGVIIAASTKSNDPVTQAAKISRKRGRIVLVGISGLELNRADFYEKELSFQVSCSYGPGRYDSGYEEDGHDYPFGFVRWTEKRNFEAVLEMMKSGQLNVKPLLSHRFLFEDAKEAYQVLANDKQALGILLKYTSPVSARSAKTISLTEKCNFDLQRPVLGFIGAGNYASRMLIPAFKAAGAQLHTVVTARGVTAALHGKKAGFFEASTEIDRLLSNPDINTIVIVTRHDMHAQLVTQALKAGKNVFVEKPLSIDLCGIMEIESAHKDRCDIALSKGGGSPHLMVGYNRRFAPQIKKMKQLLQPISEPKSFIMTINAGAIPLDHWTQSASIGGGRIIGEACHFIDLMRYLAGNRIVSVQSRCLGKSSGGTISEDSATITLGFEDGSFGNIIYLANGSTDFPKERIEVFTSGRALQLNNFRSLRGYGWPGFKKMNLWQQDKGQYPCALAFLEAIEKGGSAIPLDQIFEVAKVTIEVAEQLRRQ